MKPSDKKVEKVAKVNSLLTDAVVAHLAAAIVQVTDRGGQALSFRETILQDVGTKALRGRLLDRAEAQRVADACEAMFLKRPTVAAKSVPALVSAAKKLARCGPVIVTLEDKVFAQVASSIDELKKFCTKAQKALDDGKSIDDAITAFNTVKKTDYAKSVAAHLKALIGMTKFKPLNGDVKAALVAVADKMHIVLTAELIEYRDPAKARQILG